MPRPQSPLSTTPTLEDGPRVPANADDLGRVYGYKREDLRETSEDDQRPVFAVSSLDDAAGDGDPDETGDGDDGIAGGVVSTVVLRVAESAYADGRDRDVVSGRVPEQDGEDDDPGRRVAER